MKTSVPVQRRYFATAALLCTCVMLGIKLAFVALSMPMWAQDWLPAAIGGMCAMPLYYVVERRGSRRSRR